jgi:hypothetical protein
MASPSGAYRGLVTNVVDANLNQDKAVI